jgi:CRISPR system Cascade subunit CasC
MIQNHSPSNLNRDDLGAPKTCLFGGIIRARISSQCLKRSIRNPGNPDDVHNREPGMFAKAMEGHIGLRTKFFPDRVRDALDRLPADVGIPKDDHVKIVESVSKMTREKDKKKRIDTTSEDEGDPVDSRKRTEQLAFVEALEAERMVRILGERREADGNGYKKFVDWSWTEKQKAAKATFLGKLRPAYGHGSVDIALFGRMTTSEAFEDVEAAMQVAHAISTHAVVNEVDYFTAVDDLGKAGAGAGHVDEAMFNSACFYKYFCLDWDQLVHNLAGPVPDHDKDAEGCTKWNDDIKPKAERLAACALGHFLRAAAMATPSGKQNSFAANNEPCGILVEIKGTKTPTSYANAFAEPVERIGKPDEDAADEKSIEGRSVACVADHVQALRKAYGIDSTLLWYSPKLWRFPLHYWERSAEGKKTIAKPVTEKRFDVLGGEDGKPEGLVEAVIEALKVNLKWGEVRDAGRKVTTEA